MSIATVITLGYGSFGSVNLLPTLGYSVQTTGPAIDGIGVEAAARDWRLHGRAENHRLAVAAKDHRLHGRYAGPK